MAEDTGHPGPFEVLHQRALEIELELRRARVYWAPAEVTRVLLVCTQCGWPEITALAGRWTLEQLR